MSLELELRTMLRDVVREVVREELGERPTTLAGEMLTYEEAAELVHVSASTVKRWVKRGRLGVVGEGRIRRVRAEDLRACLAGNTRPTPPTKLDAKASVTNILASLKRSR